MKELQDYSDLIGVPFVEFGRDAAKGLDCYGLCIECARRDGKKLDDVALVRFDRAKVEKTVHTLNVRRTDTVKKGCILEFYGKDDGRLHVAYAIDGKRFIHATEFQGVRISSLESSRQRLRLENIYEVV